MGTKGPGACHGHDLALSDRDEPCPHATVARVAARHWLLKLFTDGLLEKASACPRVERGSVNGHRAVFESASRDLALAQAEYAGRAADLLTHPVQGLVGLLNARRAKMSVHCQLTTLTRPIPPEHALN